MISAKTAELSKVLLVACDQAYLYDKDKNKVLPNAPLGELHDTPGYEYSLPYSVAPGFVVTATGEDLATGFKFAAFRNTGTDEVIIAMAGTDGPNF